MNATALIAGATSAIAAGAYLARKYPAGTVGSRDRAPSREEMERDMDAAASFGGRPSAAFMNNIRDPENMSRDHAFKKRIARVPLEQLEGSVQ